MRSPNNQLNTLFCKNLVEIEVARVASLSKGIQHKDSCSIQLFSCVLRYKADIANIGEIRYPEAHGNVRLTHRGVVPAVLNWQGGYFDVTTRGNMEWL